jgi:hypothetical protein
VNTSESSFPVGPAKVFLAQERVGQMEKQIYVETADRIPMRDEPSTFGACHDVGLDSSSRGLAAIAFS